MYEDDEVNSVVSVLKSGKVNQWTGDAVKLLEKVRPRCAVGPPSRKIVTGMG